MYELKVLGIEKKIPSLIVKGVITLLLLGVATNSISELIKPETLFNPQSGAFLWQNVLTHFTLIILFIVWLALLIRTPKPLSRMHSSLQIGASIKLHRGLVLALSTPRGISPEEIIKKIKNPGEHDLTQLYGEPSIGQLFKGLYKHREHLEWVWPISTEQSYPYRKCIEAFLKQYIPKAKLADKREISCSTCLLKKCEGTELISHVKDLVSKIYDEEYLGAFGLEKSDVILDMSGGTKTITVGAIFGAIDEGINIQYVEQGPQKELIAVKITPAIVLDKTSAYLLALSNQKRQGG